MYIVINGGGKVGSYLARTLQRKGHNVAIIDKRSHVIKKLAEELPTVILLIEGDGCNVRSLQDAGVDRADVYASVTRMDEDNLVSCQLVKLNFGVKKVVARVNSPKNEHVFHSLGIEAISSTTVIGRLIEEEMTVGDIIRLYLLQKGQLALVETEIPQDNGPNSGINVSELKLPEDIVLVSIMRDDHVIIPRGNTTIKPGDRILAVTLSGKEEELLHHLQRK
jgi:trk system potassium uptake protein TrkA